MSCLLFVRKLFRMLPVWSGLLALTVVACKEESETPTGDDDTVQPTPIPSPTPDDNGLPPTPTPRPPPPLRMVASVPGQGAMAVSTGTTFTLIFNEAVNGSLDTLEVELTDSSGTTTVLTNPTLSADQTTVTYPAIGLATDTEYTLHAVYEEASDQEPQPEAWPLVQDATFTTEKPCGVAFNIMTGLQFDQLGGNANLVTRANTLISSAALDVVGMMLDDVLETTVFPVSGFSAPIATVKASTEQSGQYTVDETFGFPTSMSGCAISAGEDGVGAFTCGPDDVTFPLDSSDGTLVTVTLLDTVLTATVPSSGEVKNLDDFNLSGYMAQEDLLLLAEQLGVPNAGAVVTADADLDGDGISESATIILHSDPSWILFDWCDPTGG